MKGGRRTLIAYGVLGGLIVVLAAYLLLRDRDRMRYSLPRLAAVGGESVERITIERKTASVVLARAGGQWRLEPKGYKADAGLARAMLDAAVELSVTDLISVTRDYRRYGLDDESLLRVTLQGGGRTLRRFDVGETARTYSHTYVRLEGDDRVFQAAGDLRSRFDVDGEAVRDKVVLAFDASKLSSLRIDGGGSNVELAARPAEPGAPAGAKRQWQASDGRPREADAVEEAVRTLSRLSCLRYAEGPDPASPPLLTVLLNVEGAEHRLTVFPKADDTHPARSSQSEHLFRLGAWQVEGLSKLLAAGP